LQKGLDQLISYTKLISGSFPEGENKSTNKFFFAVALFEILRRDLIHVRFQRNFFLEGFFFAFFFAMQG
jgi:hypothetical protein